MGKRKKQHDLESCLSTVSNQLSHLASLHPLPWEEENSATWMSEMVSLCVGVGLDNEYPEFKTSSVIFRPEGRSKVPQAIGKLKVKNLEVRSSQEKFISICSFGRRAILYNTFYQDIRSIGHSLLVIYLFSSLYEKTVVP